MRRRVVCNKCSADTGVAGTLALRPQGGVIEVLFGGLPVLTSGTYVQCRDCSTSQWGRGGSQWQIMEFPAALCGALVGRGGNTIQCIRESTAAAIAVQPRADYDGVRVFRTWEQHQRISSALWVVEARGSWATLAAEVRQSTHRPLADDDAGTPRPEELAC